jgi:hypothetical protein
MEKFLDLDGLSYFWQKIKNWVTGQSYVKSTDLPEIYGPSDSLPVMDGTESSGSQQAFARGDHRHPSDTSKQDKIDSQHKLSYSLIDGAPTDVSSFNNDAGYITSSDITGKADKVQNATSGNLAALDSNGDLTDSGSKASDFLTQHQDLSNYIQKTQTSGLIKNDGTVDTTKYGTYSKPADGIPASDLATGVVPTISTDIETDSSSETKTTSPKAVKEYVDGKDTKVYNSQPVGGMLPNAVYDFGIIDTDMTFTMAQTVPGIANLWCWTFSTSSTTVNVTFPNDIVQWSGGSAPTIGKNKYYEIYVMNGYASCQEYDLPASNQNIGE